MTEPSCPKCRVAMDRGFVVDKDYGVKYAAEWVEGAPERSFWTGVKTRGKDQFPVQVYRCPICGFLESYARAE
jgi:hypothetical protein